LAADYPPGAVRLSIVIVCFGGNVDDLLGEIARQRANGDEVIVVDNKAQYGGTAGIHGHPAVDRVIEAPANLGFATAANMGARQATGDAILLLNPDAVPAGDLLERMRRPPANWVAWMGVVTLPDRERVNTAGNVAHFMGFGWIGRFREPVSALPNEPYATGFLSGACLAVRRPVWERLGGFPDHFFLYCEDMDLCHRLRLAGLPFGVLPDARIEHDYEFDKGPVKWRHLERNRWATVVRTYPLRVLSAALPAMVALEPLLLVYAVAGGWGGAKVASWWDVLRWLPSASGERRAVQGLRVRPQREFAGALVADLDTPLLGRVGRSSLANGLMRLYWLLARTIAGLRPPRPARCRLSVLRAPR
jgi:N-acetylglucosaminyl-diphospho-decaprenol L-rhamnosyltransferase